MFNPASKPGSQFSPVPNVCACTKPHLPCAEPSPTIIFQLERARMGCEPVPAALTPGLATSSTGSFFGCCFRFVELWALGLVLHQVPAFVQKTALTTHQSDPCSPEAGDFGELEADEEFELKDI